MAKITKAEMPALAEQIVKCLGGKENVARINHCATRLRVNPVDMEKVDKEGLKRLQHRFFQGRTSDHCGCHH